MKASVSGSSIIDETTLAAVEALIRKTWPAYGDMFAQEMKTYRAQPDLFEPYFAVARDGDRVVGFSFLMAAMMSVDLMAITWVAVDADHQRQGIGRRLIDCCRDEARRRGKTVMLTTTVPDFYQKMGFELLGEYNPANRHYLLLSA